MQYQPKLTGWWWWWWWWCKCVGRDGITDWCMKCQSCTHTTQTMKDCGTILNLNYFQYFWHNLVQNFMSYLNNKLLKLYNELWLTLYTVTSLSVCKLCYTSESDQKELSVLVSNFWTDRQTTTSTFNRITMQFTHTLTFTSIKSGFPMPTNLA